MGHVLERIGRCGKMVQHHVQYHAIGLEADAVQSIGQLQANVSQLVAFADLARQFEHRAAVIQRRDLREAARQFRQECAIAGADFNGRGVFVEAQLVEQGHHAFAVLRQAGDQVLLGAKLLRNP
ncbi:hypothetical protein D3C85_739210 [compost metagenome]